MKTKTKNDILLTCGILAAALLIGLLLRLGSDRGVSVTVEAGGVLLGTYSLSEDLEERFDLGDGNYNILRISEGRAEVTEADCRDQICVHHAPVSAAGETIICLPHKLVVTVTGGGK